MITYFERFLASACIRMIESLSSDRLSWIHFCDSGLLCVDVVSSVHGLNPVFSLELVSAVYFSWSTHSYAEGVDSASKGFYSSS